MSTSMFNSCLVVGPGDTNVNIRLLSAAGIPKLRKKAANHLKFKGKGHEVYREKVS